MSQLEEKDWHLHFRILWSGRFLASAGLTGISPFIPFYMESLGAGDTKNVLLWSSFALVAPAISYALVTPLWGKVSDRWSRKWMVVRALFGLAISMLLMGIAQTPFQFFLFRLCQGAFGGISDASSAFIGSDATKGQQGHALGRLEHAAAFGLLVGPFLGGLLVGVFGCRPLLLLMGGLTAICAVCAALLLTETATKGKQATVSSGVWQAFRSLYHNQEVRGFILAGILVKMADFATFAIFTPYLVERTHSPATAAVWVGMLIAMTSFGELVGAPWWGKRNDRRPIEHTFIWASLFCGVCMLVQTFVPSVEWLLLVRFLQGFFFSALLPSVILCIIRTSSDENRGVRIGATNSLLMIGQIIGPFIATSLGGWMGLTWVFFVMGSVLTLVPVIIWYTSIASSHQKINIYH